MKQTTSQAKEPQVGRQEQASERSKESADGAVLQGALAAHAWPRRCIACLRSEAQCACIHAN